MNTPRTTMVMMGLITYLQLGTGFSNIGSAQGVRITLQQAIEIAQTENKSVTASKQFESAATAEYQDAKNSILPQWSFGAEFDRYSKLTLFEDGLSDAHSIQRRPSANGVNAATRAEFSLYTGGRQRIQIQDAKIRTHIEQISTEEIKGSIALQTVVQYMEMIRLTKLDSLFGEQIRRGEVRLKNIQAMYDNGRVTKSDLLRADVSLSTNKLNSEQAANDLVLANQRLNVLLSLPRTTLLLPENPTVITDADTVIGGQFFHQSNHSYLLQRFSANVNLQQSKVDLIKSSYYPTIQLIGAYGLNYPNTLFFPPVAQWYSIGFIGVKAGINISSIYHSKEKMNAARARLAGMNLQQKTISDQVDIEINSAKIKYQETLSRMRVAKKSIDQARTNLKIINTKYLNQIALLTDLLDADNLLLESSYNLLKAQADERIYHYKLLYIQGEL